MSDSLSVFLLEPNQIDSNRLSTTVRLADPYATVTTASDLKNIDPTNLSPSIVLYGASGQEATQLAGLHELLFLGIMAPVIVMLPTVTPELYEKALQLGATDVLPKDSSAEDLQHAIRFAVARHGVSWRQDLTMMRDELTGLPNSGAFHQYLNTALSNATKVKEYEVGVVYVGVDGLKLVNSGLGRNAGDQLLIQISRRLHQAVRDRDVVARRGGDEFSILVFGPGIQDSIDIIANRILMSLKQPFQIEEQDIFSSVCLGVSLTDGRESSEELLQEADIALAKAKKRGRGQYEIFVRTMQEDALERLQLESDFRRSLVNRDFVLYYQPVVDITTNTIAYCEALVRWHHPSRGLTFPNVFLPLAEETGLVVPMGWQLLHQACRQVSKWSQEGMPIAVSVNLAAEQFASPRLQGQIDFCLSVSGIDPSLLKLEVTESSLIENQSHALQVLKDLQSLGLQVYLDDFGTGYSSLAYLERFPLYGFKIDRAFVQGVVNSERRAAILNKIVELGSILKMEVVSEGVENREELDAIFKMSCRLVQGYYFAKPMPAEAIFDFAQKLKQENIEQKATGLDSTLEVEMNDEEIEIDIEI